MSEITTENELLLTKSPEILTFCESFRHSEDLRNRADRAKRRGTMQNFFTPFYILLYNLSVVCIKKCSLGKPFS